MLIEEIRAARRAEPFQPFALFLRSGMILTVTEPLHIAIEPNGRSVSVAMPQGGFDLIETDRIESVKIMQASHTR